MVQYVFVGGLAAEGCPELLDPVVILGFFVRLQAVYRSLHAPHDGDGQQPGSLAQRSYAKAVHLRNFGAQVLDDLLVARKLRGEQNVHGAVLVQNRHLIRGQHFGGHHGGGDFHAILPEGHVFRIQRFAGIGEHLAQADNAVYGDRIPRHKLLIGGQIIAGNADLCPDKARLLDVFRFHIRSNLCLYLGLEGALVTVGGFGIGADHGFHLRIGNLTHVHIAADKVLGDDGGNVRRCQRRGQRTTSDLFIGQYEGRDGFRLQARNVHAFLFGIGGYIRDNFAGRKL